jgi:hypothetical protein
MEKVFFEYDDVKVTNTRFINGANTYAMAGVTSIKLREKKPSMGDVLAFVVISLALMGFVDKEPVALFPAIGSAVLAFFLYRKKKTLYAIILSTSGGESEGLLSNQLEYTKQVVDALNQAIIFRE